MNLSEADNIVLNGVTVPGVYVGEELIWPLNVEWVYVFTVAQDQLSFDATGGSKSLVVTSTKQKKLNGELVDNPIPVPYSSELSGTRFTLNDTTVSTDNNESTNINQGKLTLTQDSSGKEIVINLDQAAGEKVYSGYDTPVINSTLDSSNFASSGGSKVISNNNATRNHLYKWNNVGTQYKEQESGTPVISITGDGYTLTGLTIKASNNKTLATRSGVLTFTIWGESKNINLTQSAGAKVYTGYSNEDWGTTGWELSGNIPKEGGEFNFILGTATRHHDYNWNGISEDTGYDTESSPVTIVSVTGATYSGTTITVPVNDSEEDNNVVVTVTTTWNSTKEFAKLQEQGQKIYVGDPVIKSFNASANNIAATGGTSKVSAVATLTYKYTEEGPTHTEEVNLTVFKKESGDGTLSGNTVTFTNNTSTSGKSIKVGAYYGDKLVGTLDINQVAGAKVYGNWSDWVIELESNVSSVQASGGTATIDTSASRSRSYTWNGVAGSGGTESEDGNPTLSKVSGDGTLAASTGILTYTNNTSAGSRSTVIRATMGTITKDITISQAAGSKVYGSWSAWNISLSASTTSIVATGGTSTITTSATRTRPWTWNGVAGSGGTETGTGTPTLSKVSGDGTLSDNIVTYTNNTSLSGRSTVIRATIDSITKDITISQVAGSYTYGEIVISKFTTSVIPAGGGAVKDGSLSYSQTYGWNGSTTGAGTITSGLTVTYSDSISAPSLGTTVKAQTKIGELTVTVSGNGKTASSTSEVFQAANAITSYGDLSVTSQSAPEIPASGGKSKATCNVSQNITYTSGDTRSGSVSYTSTEISAASLGTTVKSRTQVGTSVITATGEGSKTKEVSVAVYQAANAKTYGAITIPSYSYPATAATGGTSTPTIGQCTQATSYTSGATSSEDITGTREFELKESVSGSSINSTNGVITWTNNTTLSGRSTVGVLTVTANGKSATKESTSSQAAGYYTYANPVVNLSYGDISAGGSTVNPTVSYSQTYGWNGSTTGVGIVSTGGSVAYSGTGVNTTNGSVSADSLGTTVKSRTKITTSTVTVTLNGKSGSKSFDVYQAANSKSYGAISIASLAYSTVAAAGGSSTPTIGAITQATSFTSGAASSETITGTKSFALRSSVSGSAISSTTGAITWANNTSTSVRSVVGVLTVSANGATVTKEATCSQSAGAQVFANPVINQFYYDERDAAGGTLTPSVSYSQSWTWNGVAGSGGTVTSGGTYSATIPTPVTGASVAASTGIVTWAANQGGAREVTVSLTVTVNGKTSAAKTAVAKQNADSIKSYSDITINNFTVGDIPASGGNISSGTVSYVQVVNYVSGKTTNITSGATVTYSTAVSASSLGTTAKSRTKVGALTVTVSLNSKSSSKAVDVYQAANAITSYSELTGGSVTAADIPASGGTRSATVTNMSQTVTYTSGATRAGTVTNSQTAAITGSSLGTTAKARTKLGAITVTFLGEGSKKATKAVDVYQAANAITTYGAVTISGGSVSDIPAGGGSVSSASGISAAQTITYTSGSTRAGSVKITYSAAVSATSKGTTVTARSKIGTLTATATGEGSKTATKAFDVYQAANSITYGNPVVKITYSDISAGGSTVTPTVTFTQSLTYTSGSTGSNTTGGTKSFSGTSVNTTTGAVSASSLGTTTKARTKITTGSVTVTVNGKSGSASADVYQAANSATYANPVVSMTYGDISAGGSTVTPSVRFTQSVSYTSGSTSSVTSGGTKTFAGTSVNTSTGAVSGSSLGTTVRSRTKITTSTVTITVNGKSGSKAVDVYQAANAITSYSELTGGSVTAADIPASGGTRSATVTNMSQTVTYTSGATRAGTVTNSQTAAITGSSLGTTAKARTKLGAITVTFLGEGSKKATKAVDVYQAANAITTYGAVTISGGSVSDIPAGGGSVSSASGISAAQTITYTSGSTRAGSVKITYSAAVSATSKGTTVTARSKIGTLTATATGEGSKTATKAFDVYQAANSITYGNPVVKITYSDISAGGSTVTPTVTFTQSLTYTSGSTGSNTTGGTKSFSGTSVNTTTGAVSASSLGTTTKARTKITTGSVTVTVNGKSGSASADVYQAANSATYANPVVSMTYGDISAGGSTVTPSVRFTQSVSYTSGSTSSVTSGGTKTFAGTSVNTSTGAVSGSSLGTTVRSRTKITTSTVTITVNGKSGSKAVDVYQAANAITSTTTGSWTVAISANPTTIAALGGTSTITATATAHKTNHYTSGATSSAGNATATPTLSISGTGFTLSSGKVTASENTAASTRTCTVTATSNGASKSVTITQSAATITWNYELTVTPSSLTFEAAGGTQSVTVVSRRQKVINGKPTSTYENVAWTAS